jgi:DNA replication initiation complex subunit (GINS family)
MSEPIKSEHIEQYIKRNYDVTLSTVQSDDVLFEALSETITELNPEASVGQLAKDFNEQNKEETVEQYATRKFDELVNEETTKIISYAQKNCWIEYTKRGMLENGAEEEN